MGATSGLNNFQSDSISDVQTSRTGRRFAAFPLNWLLCSGRLVARAYGWPWNQR
jgi:hypothetical protein